MIQNFKKKYAIIFPGNLSTYFLCLENYKILCKSENVDFYILYSKNYNYTHTNLDGKNKFFKITNHDIQIIQNDLGSNIKYMNSIEDEPHYQEIFDKYINQFKKNICWAKDIPLAQFNYETLISDKGSEKYMDQFIRTYYLYNKVIETKIDYDYIIRMRIDQYYDKSFLENLFYKLDNNDKCNFLWLGMDNFYIISNQNIVFFQKLVDEIGSLSKKKYNSYELGPETQFYLLVNKYIETPKIISDVLNLNVRITISIFTTKKQYMYNYDYTTICFSKYCEINKITMDNFEKKLDENKNINIYENKISIEKYNDTIFWVYSIY